MTSKNMTKVTNMEGNEVFLYQGIHLSKSAISQIDFYQNWGGETNSGLEDAIITINETVAFISECFGDRVVDPAEAVKIMSNLVSVRRGIEKLAVPQLYSKYLP